MNHPTRSGPRVCVLTESFPPDVLGGLELHAKQLAEHLLTRRLQVQILTRRVCADAPARELVGNVPVVRIGSGGLLKGRGWQALGPLLSFLTAAAAWLISNRRSYDVVLALGSKVLPIPALAAGLQPAKRVVFKPESPIEFREVIYSMDAVADRYVALLRSLRLPSENSGAEPVDADGPTDGGATRPTADRGR